ncbi:hypothetical protein [Mesorhizobium sp.]|uniref:hypothetical protein n=1 Tax=Mesorhizobium sp. TaxID=1871066 RepID=UPI000FE96A1D|nr:hypothetical protein [Mesorhizobium sp.]RWI35441.1 MAG: hypothetical protein EOR14_28480 [Mesorhizobium sp.]RWJ66390.1 MAG: hypothetical protein EOR34_28655 [Mesorhizobium sp.]
MQVPEQRFIDVYNDLEKYPTLMDVALELNISYQTVRNKSCIIRAKQRRGEDVPELISRVVIGKKADNDNAPQLSARDHAKARADQLRSEVTALLQKSRYPVVNPEAIVVESYVSTVYDKINQIQVEKEGTPRTWLSDTLRVQGVEDPRGRRFIFTGAQNDAEIHHAFWENLKAYADFLDADIVVGPWTYETQWWSENNPTSRAYDTELTEYLCFGQMAIGDKFMFAGEMNTLPTANRPISDLTTYSCGRWAVFPHAKLQLKSVPTTDPNIQAHQVMTSGAVTRPKVIPRKAGVKSIFHHVIGATIVEFDQDGDIFCRQINASDDGSFYELEAFVANGQVTTYEGGIRGLVAGDIHRRKLNRVNCAATFGFDPDDNTYHGGSILETLQPQEVLAHDLHDNEARNHHHVHDNAYSYEMAIRDRESVFDEVSQGTTFLKQLLNASAAKITVIPSNHDIALDRYVREGRYRNDGINIKYGMRLEMAYLEWREQVALALDSGQKPPTFSLLEWAMRDIAGAALDPVHFVHDGQSHIIEGIECGNHGFRGANGARGTVAGFAQLGRKMTIADKHSPEILDGVYVAGCMELQHGYNKGPSGWAVAHVIIYPNGKRALITLQNGKWRA